VKFQEAFKRASMQLTSDLHLQHIPAAASVGEDSTELEDGELPEDGEMVYADQ
jgi:hypothetical protein